MGEGRGERGEHECRRELDMHYLTTAVLFVLKFAVIIVAFFGLTLGGIVAVFTLFPQLHFLVWMLLLFPYFWLVNRFVLSPLQYKFGIKFKQYDPWYENRVAALNPTAEEPTHRPPRGEDEPFFECVRSSRHLVYIVFAIIFGGAGVAGLVAVIIAAARQQIEINENTLLGLIAGTIWITGMLGIGGMIGWQLLRNRELTFRIDRRGISISREHWPWSDIRWIGLRTAGSFDNSVYFAFGTRGPSPDRWLPYYPPVARVEALQAIEDIAAYLDEHFPDVSVN